MSYIINELKEKLAAAEQQEEAKKQLAEKVKSYKDRCFETSWKNKRGAIIGHAFIRFNGKLAICGAEIDQILITTSAGSRRDSWQYDNHVGVKSSLEYMSEDFENQMYRYTEISLEQFLNLREAVSMNAKGFMQFLQKELPSQYYSQPASEFKLDVNHIKFPVHLSGFFTSPFITNEGCYLVTSNSIKQVESKIKEELDAHYRCSPYYEECDHRYVERMFRNIEEVKKLVGEMKN